MEIASRVERRLVQAAGHVGRAVYAIGRTLPRVVASASGIPRPSTAATTAAVARGAVALAAAPLGGFAGPCVELAADAAVLAYAAWIAGGWSAMGSAAATITAAEQRAFIVKLPRAA